MTDKPEHDPVHEDVEPVLEPVVEPVLEPVLTPEQIAGRPLVDLTAAELQDVAREVDLDGRSSMKRDELIVGLGGDPDAMTDSERVEAAAAQAEREAEGPHDDPNELPPWERHDDVDEPLTTERLLEMIAASQGAVTESTIDPETGERSTYTWADAELAAAAKRDALEPGPPVDEPS